MPALPFTAPWLLAPMEGVTEPCFRDLVLARNPAAALGGAFTEFVRVAQGPLPRRTLREHLGPLRFEAPVGLQIMGADVAAVAATAARAVEVGAPLVDLNFGCPARGALRGCAGSALLKDPPSLERLVRATVQAVAGAVPVSAKIRAGFDDAERVEELAAAVEQAGAGRQTVHCRTRREGYAREVDWSRIARAVGAVSIPVCGNGGVHAHADLERMRRETGCAFVMVGQAALGDPWIFSGRAVGAADAARFLLDYAELLGSRRAVTPRGVAGRVKQLLGHWTAGGLTGGEPSSWMREREPERLLERLEAAAADGRDPRANPLLPRPGWGLDARRSEGRGSGSEAVGPGSSAAAAAPRSPASSAT
jgi:tRNA-dihydrouridine synthase